MGFGGAVGATFYLEPVATIDVDIFVTMEPPPGLVLISLAPIYSYLVEHGHVLRGEYVMISGWPIQFLPPTGALVEEALTHALTIDVEGVLAPVFSAEHLAAIALQTGRAKDKARLLQFIESNVLDKQAFLAIITRHDLEDRWRQFEQMFLGDHG